MLADLLADFIKEFTTFVKEKPQEATQYVRVRSILTKNEAYFYQLLLDIGYRHIVIVTKVRLADIFKVEGRQYSKGWRTHFNRIAMKHVDFLIIDQNGTPIVGIELDDSTHQRPDRQASDQFKDSIFRACQIPLERFSLHFNYTSQGIHARLKNLIPDYARRHLEPPPPPPQPPKPQKPPQAPIHRAKTLMEIQAEQISKNEAQSTPVFEKSYQEFLQKKYSP